jgi:hypothetical protein
MRTRTLTARIERAEQTAKAEHRFSAECICFPEKEPPFFAFEIRWTNPSSTKRWEYVGSAGTSSAAPNIIGWG